MSECPKKITSSRTLLVAYVCGADVCVHFNNFGYPQRKLLSISYTKRFNIGPHKDYKRKALIKKNWVSYNAVKGKTDNNDGTAVLHGNTSLLNFFWN